MSPNMTLYEDLLPHSSFVSTREDLASSVRYSDLRANTLAAQDSGYTARQGPPTTSSHPFYTKSSASSNPGPTSSSLANKVKGLLFSYLPKTSKPPPKPTEGLKAPCLPPPPSDLLHKPRPLITTPVPKPEPKAPHPKDLVQLRPVLSNICSHAPQGRPPSSTSFVSSFSRQRRDSGASVKDLVRTFETLEKTQTAACESMKALELRKKKGIQNWNEGCAPKPKPVWKP